MRNSYDVIVVGGGGSGLAAAVSAAEHGASVLLLEKEPALGGTTGIAVGSFTACGTSYQRSAHIEDDPLLHGEDVAKFAPPAIEECNNDALRQFFLQHTAETLEWLRGLGLTFHGPVPEPPNRVPRMHNVVPGAKAYIATLQARLLRLGGQIICNANVRELVVESGRVMGVVAEVVDERKTFRARRGIVLAAGDYANSPELIAAHKGRQFEAIEGVNPAATGDGHRLAESVGARLVNMDLANGPQIRFVAPPRRSVLDRLPVRLSAAVFPFVPRPLLHGLIKRVLVIWQRPENALFADGAILVNARGERFCDEAATPAREVALARQPGKVGYILLDERLIARYSAWPHYISTAPEIAYAYVADYLRLRPDVTALGSTPSEVARARGIPAERLQATVEGRSLRGNRWLLLGPAKAYFTTTEGGTAVNERLQVLGENDAPIAGLYAVGQNGLGGMVLFGHGLHIAWALTSGRLVGLQLGAVAAAGEEPVASETARDADGRT